MVCRLLLPLLIAGSFAAPSASAMAILDQENDFISGVANPTNGGVSEVGQTFTVGIEGTLDRIEVLMFGLGGFLAPTSDPVLSVYRVVGGLPDGPALATVSVPRATVPLNFGGFVAFDVRTAALSVEVGDLLAFGLRDAAFGGGGFFLPVRGDTGKVTDFATGDAVARLAGTENGWSLLEPAQDHGFRTFVVPIPEPGSALLVGLGVLGTAASGAFRRRSSPRREEPPRGVAETAASTQER